MLSYLACMAFVVPLLIIAVRSVRKRRSPLEVGGLAALSFALFLLVNPIGQIVVMVLIDEPMRDQLAARVHVGMSTDELTAAVGAPCVKRPDVWEYAAAPFSWMAHDDHFTVYVDRDRVVGIVRGG